MPRLYESKLPLLSMAVPAWLTTCELGMSGWVKLARSFTPNSVGESASVTVLRIALALAPRHLTDLRLADPPSSKFVLCSGMCHFYKHWDRGLRYQNIH